MQSTNECLQVQHKCTLCSRMSMCTYIYVWLTCYGHILPDLPLNMWPTSCLLVFYLAFTNCDLSYLCKHPGFFIFFSNSNFREWKPFFSSVIDHWVDLWNFTDYTPAAAVVLLQRVKGWDLFFDGSGLIWNRNASVSNTTQCIYQLEILEYNDLTWLIITDNPLTHFKCTFQMQMDPAKSHTLRFSLKT